jgi:hypothetical protein
MALVDLKRTKADKKADKDGMKSSPGIDQEDYPYGTRIHLGPEELDKLGMSDNPKVGDSVHVHGHGHVTSVSEDHRENGKKHRRVEIHLKHMEVKKGEHKPGRAGGEKADQADGMKGAMDGALAEADGADGD